ncbi:MAG: GTPase HflX [Clostridiales bacterium]|nr:GTPase HflX [Clostridiales bacterium]
MKKFYQIQEEEIEKAILFCPIVDEREKEYQFAEISRLCTSAGMRVEKIFSQKMDAFNRRTVMGTGKLEEVKQYLKENPCDCLVVDFQLTGSQLRNLSEELGVKVLDRILLIIDIFAVNAKSSEGKIEVKLAQNRYLLTRLASLQGSQGRFGGKGAGMRGPGETKLELDRRKLEKEILTLEKEIEKIKNSRKQNKILRDKNNIKSVVLGGYTNAGKSSIFNLLTKETVYADDKLFATLDTTSRRLFLGEGENCLLTDTVGFISKLPHELVESFSSTLEEVSNADLILHVVDVSDVYYKKNIEITNEILDGLGATDNRIVVLNKSDLLDRMVEIEKNQVLFSIKKKDNVDKLKKIIKDALQ